MTALVKVLRCAVYTRVSTEYGLEQEFNSLDNQREAAEAYVKSQAHEGWRLHRDPYDDGGFSGGSMDRPALQRLLAVIREKKIDVVVVYKVDRLTRSLADFAKLVELFDAHGVSFVSVTQSFNTTTSMGRLTLNVLLSFAQYERELTGERIRDKVAASKRKGMRMGGPIPFGYDVADKKLIINPKEAEHVRLIFRQYLKLGSLNETLADLRRRKIVSKRNRRKDGSVRGGVSFEKGALSYLIRNRVYVGEIVHKGKYFAGEHQPILDRVLFDSVQRKLAANGHALRAGRLTDAFLLTGRIFDDRGNRMTPATANKSSVRYRYYVSHALSQGRADEAGSVPRIGAPDIEEAVLTALRERRKCASTGKVREDQLDRPLISAELLRVDVRKDSLELAVGGKGDSPPEKITVRWVHKPVKRRREVIPANAPNGHRPIRSETRARLIEGIAKGRQWVDELVSATGISTMDLAKREGCTERSVRMYISLAFLSPELVRSAVNGTLSDNTGVAQLIDPSPLWAKQMDCLDKKPHRNCFV